ncbi:MAG: hypothetical protein ACRBEQ_07400 [Hyphomonas sp.]
MLPESVPGVAVPPAEAVRTVQLKAEPEQIDLAFFQSSLDRMRKAGEVATDAIQPAVDAVMETITQLDAKGRDLSEVAEAASNSGSEMTPGEMIMLTVRAHEFLFNSQLTANVANRTADGLQQLFRQQG